MRCPECATELLAVVRDGVEIRHCGQCRGVWLKRDELDKMLAATEMRAVRYIPHERFAAADPGASVGRSSETQRGRRGRSFLSLLFDFD